ncbi:MAG: hypothetical protein JWN86_466, partial [Planctomycetota bacterium]|nr:hypothetical protein [Planctomycetota bacterium]
MAGDFLGETNVYPFRVIEQNSDGTALHIAFLPHCFGPRRDGVGGRGQLRLMWSGFDFDSR